MSAPSDPSQCSFQPQNLSAWFSGDQSTDALRRGAQRIVLQMRVTVRSRGLRVPEERADDRQAEPGANELAGKTVTQIVDSKVLDLCGFADRRPCRLHLDSVSANATRENVLRPIALSIKIRK